MSNRNRVVTNPSSDYAGVPWEPETTKINIPIENREGLFPFTITNNTEKTPTAPTTKKGKGS